MADAGHDWTDEQILKLEKRVRKAYETAYKELKKKNASWLKDYDARNKQWKADLKAGKVTKDEYDGWLKGQAVMKAYRSDMAVQASRAMSSTADTTAAIVKDAMPNIYAENANFAAFQIDGQLGMMTTFTMYDEDTVRRLLAEQPHLLPEISPDKRKVTAHVKRKITNEVTQGILQGESIPDIAERLKTVVGMEQGAAIRAARTACTGAENAGRVAGYKRAESIGVKMQQEWLATLDARTRDSHRLADGQKVDVGAEFDVGNGKLRYPGDPAGPPEEVYNCRCTIIAAVEGVDQSAAERWSKLPSGMTYEQWKFEHMTDTDELKWKLDKAQSEADKLKPHNKTFSGIWKDDVTLDDYEAKKGSIQAKKDYYSTQMPNATAVKQAEYQKHLQDIAEFEQLGPEYVKQKAMYEAAMSEVKNLKAKLASLSPTAANPITRDRMDAGLSFATAEEADKYLRAKSGELWRNASPAEKDGIYGYTVSSGAWNRPLSGFEKPYSAYGGGWEKQYYKGPKNVWIDYEGKGDDIRAMTDLIARSTYDDDVWLSRGCGESWIESILGEPYGSISAMDDAELQRFVGVSGRSYSFTSCGSADGLGFTREVKVRIFCPTGTQMMYVEPFSHYSGASAKKGWNGKSTQKSFGYEDETIIQRGASYEVVSIKRSQGKLDVELAVHPEDGFDTFQQDPADWTGPMVKGR